MARANRIRGEVQFEKWVLHPQHSVVLYLEERFGTLFDAFNGIKRGRYTETCEVLWAGASRAGELASPTRDEVHEKVLALGISDPRVALPAGQFLGDILVGLSKPIATDEDEAPEADGTKSAVDADAGDRVRDVSLDA